MNSPWLKRVSNDLFVRLLSAFPIRNLIDRLTIDTDELGAIGKETGAFWSYTSPETLRLEKPALGDLPDEIDAKVGRHQMEQPFVAELRNCELVGPYGVTIFDRKYVLENSLRSENLLVRNLLSTLVTGTVPRPLSKNPDTERNTAISMVGPWCRGYFHWFSEWLPRLEGAYRYIEQTGRDPTLIVPPNPPGWMRDSLRLVGFGPDKWFEQEGPRTSVDRLVIPSVRRLAPIGNPDAGYTNAPSGYRWASDRILNSLERSDGESYSDRVYISRCKAEERRVVNEDELMGLLGRRGFASYTLEEMSFEDQVRLFAGADTIVAPHGAGLVNGMYADDLTVIELFGDYVNACYFTMTQGLGHEYACLQCDPEGPHLRVDTDRLRELLDQMGIDGRSSHSK